MCDGEKLTLTLGRPEKINNKKILIGQVVSGTVESMNNDGLFVRTLSENSQGFLPVNQLSVDCKLSKTIFGKSVVKF